MPTSSFDRPGTAESLSSALNIDDLDEFATARRAQEIADELRSRKAETAALQSELDVVNKRIIEIEDANSVLANNTSKLYAEAKVEVGARDEELKALRAEICETKEELIRLAGITPRDAQPKSR